VSEHGGRFIVLLNDALKSHISSLAEKERQRLREKFEFLEQGFWDAGVRVKKLRGTSGRVVFEARLTRSDRLLFTLGDHQGKTAIYVWGIVRHDDISSEAARIVPANAPFLDFEPLSSDERPDLTLQTVPQEWLSQEDVEQKVPDDYGPQRWLVLDDEEWRRLLLSPGSSPWEAFLFLTREQDDLLRASPPILLSGTAGSGKTTLSVYYLLRGASSGQKRLFLTYNPLLKTLAERIYAGLAENRGGLADAPPPRFLVFRDLLKEIVTDADRRFPDEKEVGLRRFTQIFNDHKDRKRYDAELVWEEIRSIIKGAKLPLAASRLARLAGRFASRDLSPRDRGELWEHLIGLQELSIARRAETLIRQKTALVDYAGFLRAVIERSNAEDCERVLTEIAQWVSTRAADFTSPLLSEEEYGALGRKRAPSFLYDRREIYGIALYYQDRIERLGLWDEIDLTKAAIRTLDGATQEFSWDLLVCDEVQDLTDVQVSLLFRLLSDPRGIVLTGDPRQIINPSGFRWEEVKGKLYERGLSAPVVRRLSLNFRCVGSIVRLSNALLDLKAGLIGLTDTEMREEWKFGGRPPALLVSLDEAEVIPLIDMRAAGQVILARTVESRDRLKKALGTELVFTISEAKGLEFDTVVLWKFCEDGEAAPTWRAIASGQPVDQSRIPHVRHELALLYVAVTRARTTLIIFDGPDPALLWDIPSLSPLVFRTADQNALSGLWHAVSTPQEWDAQGDYFLGHEQYAAARECFRNAGNDSKQALAGGLLLLGEGRPEEAAPLLEAAGETARAADCYERVGLWGRAMPLWHDLSEPRRETLCAAHLHEERKEYAAAARAWDSLGETERGLVSWEKAGAYDKVGRALAAAGKYDRAAPLLEKARLPLEAAACYVRLGQAVKAADLYFRAGDVKHAATLYKKAGEEEKLLRCYRQLGDFQSVAEHLEARGDVRRAVEAFARYVEGSPERRDELIASIPKGTTKKSARKAAIRRAALDQPQEAAPLFMRAGDLREAAREFEKAGDYAGLSACLEDDGRYRESAEAMEKADLESGAMVKEIEYLLYQHLAASEGRENAVAQELHAEAIRMKNEGRHLPALARFRLLHDDTAVVAIYRELGRFEEGIAYFIESENPAAALSLARSEGFSIPRAYVESLVRKVWVDSPIADAELSRMRELFVRLLDRGLQGVSLEEGRELVELFFRKAYGSHIPEELLSRGAQDLLIAWRAANVIIRILYINITLRDGLSPLMRDFVERVSAQAKDTADPGLEACAAYVERHDDFERTVASMQVSAVNATVLGLSDSRYRDGVLFLSDNGRFSEAEYCGRIHRDYALLAGCAEKAGELITAAGYYVNADDLDSALRCFQEAKDARGVARVYEKMGRFSEAIAIWEGLGHRKDVERVMKKQAAHRV
jgi:tetratricopeptide (TPR) repeat protein